MENFNKNYEDIKLYLYQNIQEASLDEVIASLEESLSLSTKQIQEVFEAMQEDMEVVIVKDQLYLIDGIHYAAGKLRVIRGKFAFVGEGDDAVYIAQEDFKDALDQDIVLVKVFHSKKSYGVIESVLERGREYLLGTLEVIKHRFVFVPYDRKIPNRVKYKANHIEPIAGQRIIAKIDGVNGGVIEASLKSVLGMKNEPGIDILSVLFAHDLETEFNEQVLEEAKQIPNVVHEKEIEGRIDHRDQYAVTVDGEDAKDLDDAIYIERLNEGYRLYVHIADVSHYVEANSAIDKTAYHRTSSIYMVDRVIPMLPETISNGICSLHPNVDRLTLTCKMDLDLSGEIYNAEVYPSVIRSKRRMSYNEINDGEDFGEVTEMVEMMLHCAEILQRKRTEAGSIDFDSSESHFLVDDQGAILDINARETGIAEKMIENFMVSANESVAKYAQYQELPILYRVHEKPDQDKMKDFAHTLLILGYRLKGNLADVHPHALQSVLKHFEGKDESLVISRLMLRSMKKARYAPEALGHFGLALKDYSHFTAPIRRYSDLLTHRNLRKYVFDSNFSEFKEDHAFTQDAAQHISEVERVILDAEREVEKMKKAEYMRNKIGERYDGIISGVNNFGVFVELSNTVEGVVLLRELQDDYYTLDPKTHKLVGERTKKVYALGQKVKVQVVSVDPLENDVIFRFIDTKRKGRKYVKHRKKQKSIS